MVGQAGPLSLFGVNRPSRLCVSLLQGGSRLQALQIKLLRGNTTWPLVPAFKGTRCPSWSPPGVLVSHSYAGHQPRPNRGGCRSCNGKSTLPQTRAQGHVSREKEEAADCSEHP